MSRLSLFLILSFTLASAPYAQAIVRVNHGPAFHLTRSRGGEISTQKGLFALYAAWNLAHDDENYNLRKAIARRNAPDFPPLLTPTDLATNYLDFGYKYTNGTYHDWDFVRTEYGYCQGMTMVTRNFAYLARFDGVQPAPFSYDSEPEKWLTFYRGIVDSIMQNRPAVIPGFHNLVEFSRSPIADYLKRHVADQWGLSTALLTNYRNIYRKNFKAITNQAELDLLREKIEFFHAHGFYPRIVLGSQRYSMNDPHVVMVTALAPANSGDNGCLSLSFFNLGSDRGGHHDTFTVCVGDRAWIPNDEKLYFYDFAHELTRSNAETTPVPR